MRNIKNILLVSRREYIKVVRKPTFWISTLLFPMFIVVISVISGLSANQSKEMMSVNFADIKKIYIQDKTPQNLIKLKEFADDQIFNSTNSNKIVFINDSEVEKVIEEVRTGNANALVIYPESFIQNNIITIYSDQSNPFSKEKYNAFADALFKKNLVSQIVEKDLITLYSVPLQYNVISYENGKIDTRGFEMYIVPYGSMLIYILLVSFATSYLLLSVSEEKENRMIETVLSIIKPSELITGKIIGQVAIVITQVLLLLGLSIAVLAVSATKLPIDLSTIQIQPMQIILGLVYTMLGFIFLSTVMVGVGAATPNYKDAQSLSSIFIVLAMFPLYFIMLIMSEPNGTISMIASYLPFTSSIVLIFRNAIVTLPWWEIVLSITVQIVYVIIGTVVAYKLFEIGSLEYSQRISFKAIKSGLKKKK